MGKITNGENYYRINITYSNNSIFEGINQEWTGTQWINSDRSIFTYTGNNLTQVLNEEWNGAQWTVVDSYRDIFTYNANNKKTAYILETWENSTWEEEERIEYVLDATGNRTTETEIFNGNNQYRVEYNYDTTSLLSDFFHPFNDKTGADYIYEDVPHVNAITSQTILISNPSTNNLEVTARVIYDYNNQITLNVQNFEASNNVTIYPNPSSEFIAIEGLQQNETVSIYNVLGTLVKEKYVTPNQRIAIKDLNSGMYFLKLENGYTIKFVKN
ncbi:T9SS type A sorting domain-containing protein [uncultured Winogradskyella sp.]|uniref:T9SS type A sorting domain-containing protein n=1 Tax=uncultured Winogradskyella sp. TaxID=395353 RepID=UPI00344E4CA7